MGRHDADTWTARDVVCERMVCDKQDARGPVETQVIPDGDVGSSQGNFIVDAESARLILAAFEETNLDLVFDYEHQTLGGEYSSPDGTAPAAGWIKSLRYEAGRGIIASVEWNERAREMIRAGEYAYPSPVVVVRKRDRKAIELHSVALTNAPAIRDIERLAAKDKETDVNGKTQANQEGTEGGEMTPDLLLGQIAQLLKQKGVALEEGASRDTMLQAVIKLLEGDSSKTEDEGGAEAEEVASSIRAELGLKESAGMDAVLVALSTLRRKAGAGGDLAKVQAELGAMKGREADRMAKELVDADITANKVNPNDKQHVERCLVFAKKDPDGYRAFMDGVKPFAEVGRTEAPPGGGPSTGGSSAEEDKLIDAAMTAHKGNTKLAHISLQSELLDKECAATGYTRKKAAEVLSQRYPKIFG